MSRPQYNEWIVAREIVVSGFSADADWVATQDATLADGVGGRAPHFQIPNLPGRPAEGFAIMLVGLTAGGGPVVPGTLDATVELIELLHYSGGYNDHALHVADVADPAAPLTPLGFVLPANLAVRVPGTGGAQCQYAVRATAITGGAAVTLRILIKPLGGPA